METDWQNGKKIIKDDGVVVLPTDTIYGIVGSAFSKKAILRMYEIKGRDRKKPFIVLISDLKELEKFKIDYSSIIINNKIQKLFKPGVSVLLPCPDKKFSYLHRGTKKIAFRLISKRNKNLFNLINKIGPIGTSSVNPEGLQPASTIKEAEKYFGGKVDLYIYGGRKNINPSTLVELKNDRILVIRQGKVSIK